MDDLDKLTADQTRGKVLIVDPRRRPTGAGASVAAVLARLKPALVVVLVNGPGGRTGSGTTPQLRAADGPIMPTLFVWDKAVREALADAKAGPLEATVSAHIAAPKSEPVTLRNVVGRAARVRSRR